MGKVLVYNFESNCSVKLGVQGLVDSTHTTTAKYFDDLMRVTEGLSDQEMADALVRGSFPTMRWLYEQGIRFVPSWSHQAFKDGEVYRFWGGLCLEAVGAGKGLSDQLFAVAQERGVEVRYDTAAVRLTTNDAGGVAGVVVRTPVTEVLDAPTSGTVQWVVIRSCGAASAPRDAAGEWKNRQAAPGASTQRWDGVSLTSAADSTGLSW